MRGRPVFPVVLLGALSAVAGSLASGCGGTQLDAHEVSGRFRVQIVHASFPALQSIARPARMVLRVRNPGPRTVPNVAVTLDSFTYQSTFRELAARQRPVWIVDGGPGTVPRRLVQTETVDPAGGGQTAYLNTWALGPLAPGAAKTFVWLVTPVKAGTHQVSYVVSAGLNGKARARLAGGGFPVGRFLVNIAPEPPARHVNPETGRIVPGPYPYVP
ncbi:MAG: hypothetical protein ACHQDY_04845 [Solirubrobacterales bacterium]